MAGLWLDAAFLLSLSGNPFSEKSDFVKKTKS